MAAKKAPAHMGAAARKLWREVTKTYDLRADELRVLEDACREMDVIDFLEEQRRDEDFAVMIRGSQGQMVMNPVFAELRQHRGALRQLLAQLKLPDEDGQAEGGRSTQARDAAAARWRRGA